MVAPELHATLGTVGKGDVFADKKSGDPRGVQDGRAVGAFFLAVQRDLTPVEAK